MHWRERNQNIERWAGPDNAKAHALSQTWLPYIFFKHGIIENGRQVGRTHVCVRPEAEADLATYSTSFQIC